MAKVNFRGISLLSRVRTDTQHLIMRGNTNIGRSDAWKENEVKFCLDQMLKADRALYEQVLDSSKGYAYWQNVLCIIASHSMWSAQDAQDYLRTGSKDRKVWERAREADRRKETQNR